MNLPYKVEYTNSSNGDKLIIGYVSAAKAKDVAVQFNSIKNSNIKAKYLGRA